MAAAVVALTVRTSPLDPPYQSVRPGPVLVQGYAAVVLLGDRLLPEGSSLAVADQTMQPTTASLWLRARP